MNIGAIERSIDQQCWKKNLIGNKLLPTSIQHGFFFDKGLVIFSPAVEGWSRSGALGEGVQNYLEDLLGGGKHFLNFF